MSIDIGVAEAIIIIVCICAVLFCIYLVSQVESISQMKFELKSQSYLINAS